MILFPTLLNTSDKVGIIPPASNIPASYLKQAAEMLNSWGLEVVFSSNFRSKYYSFAGPDSDRLQALQTFLDDSAMKAIFCARGGYGTSRIVDQINLSKFKRNPKWVIGFSDITILLNRLLAENIGCIHGPMPINFNEKDASVSLKFLKDFLFYGTYPKISFRSEQMNKTGSARGQLVGGNLTMLTNSIGTGTQVSTNGKILFIEDVDERLYRIDRMILHLKRAGVFEGLTGLMVGHFTKIDDRKKFGFSLNEIILSHTEPYGFPISFNAPIGHIMPNHPMVLGKTVLLEVLSRQASLQLE